MAFHFIYRQTFATLRRLRRALHPSPCSTNGNEPQSLRSTAWLDGLRGLAALSVFILHHEEYGHHMSKYIIIEDPWGLNGQYHIATFPFIRLIFSGGIFAVPIFFIISGYVLAHKPLQLVQQQDFSVLAKSTGSSLFRRWGRLFLPVYVSTFIWMSSWYALGFRSLAKGSPELLDSWTAELRRWWDLHNAGDITGYNPHLWTIPEEFWGSVFIYCTILATSRFSKEARLVTEVAMCAYRLYLAKVDALFFVGLIFCDISLLSEAKQLPNLLKRVRPRHQGMWYIFLVLGLYMSALGHGFAGEPQHFSAYPGWSALHLLLPPNYPDFKFWYRFWGSTLAVTSIPQISSCKHILEMRFPQYLGRVSYSFYLIHGPLLWSVGVRMYAACGLARRYRQIRTCDNWMKLPNTGPLGMEVRWLLPMLFMLILTLAVADLFTQLVDEPSIKFVQWAFSEGVDGTPKNAYALQQVDPESTPEGNPCDNVLIV
ncbi:hypothetical protein CB0940_08240 [Cercospora beticola]|uniref:Acyltransferase 3 domain-containing protein n=1 Tax=Cercospora beticola TaxID=122368 RepID=A0A2G5HQQ5_CERBT|nr:hypothetical protein CB0940_08240 [Cercospora beticola]PIA94860.1 hypothetical protein CB0940_08240 [Cercospora beticola]WPB04808.1 hypothetical protein RHO25_009455 [Cercospora beticola]